jgi:hypothetical protein
MKIQTASILREPLYNSKPRLLGWKEVSSTPKFLAEDLNKEKNNEFLR